MDCNYGLWVMYVVGRAVWLGSARRDDVLCTCMVFDVVIDMDRDGGRDMECAPIWFVLGTSTELIST